MRSGGWWKRGKGSDGGRSDREVALRLDHVERLGVDGVDVEPVRDVLAFLVGLSLVGSAHGTPELGLVGAVPPALRADPETDQLLALVLDDRVPTDAGVTADDEVLHVSALAGSSLNRFGTDDPSVGVEPDSRPRSIPAVRRLA